MRISIIVAIAENNAIGLNNKLIYWLPNDLKRFKQLTTGNTIIQDIWIQMQDKKHLFKEGNNFKGWVYMCCRNYFYSFLRERKKKIDREFSTDYIRGVSNNHTPEKDYISREVVKRLNEAIKRLTREQQQVAEMLIDGVPYSRMAHRLDCSENTVRGRIFRLRNNLKVAN